MKTRRFLALILSFIMIFGLCGTVLAEEGSATGDVYKYVSSVTPGKEYIIVSNGHAVQKKDGAITDVAVTVSGDTVTLNSGTDASSVLWTITEAGSDYATYGQYFVKNGADYLARTTGTEYYLVTRTDQHRYGTWSYYNNGTAFRQYSNSTYTFYTYADASGKFVVVNSPSSVPETPVKLYEKAGGTTPQPPVTETGTYSISAADISKTVADGDTAALTYTITYTPVGGTAQTVTDLGGTAAYEIVSGNAIGRIADGSFIFNGTAGTAAVKVSYTWTADGTAKTITDTFSITAKASGTNPNPSGEIVIIAGSDFQAVDGDGASSENVSGILSAIKKDHPAANGFIFCGDYDKHLYTRNVAVSLQALKDTVESFYGSELDEFYVQGNHDNVAQGTNGLSGPGAHDTEDYGVFLIDEDDYQWGYFVKEDRIKQTAANLKAYIDAKVEEGYKKPIFVASHVGFQFTVRTANDGDGRFAKYLFDILNEGGQKGLNIIFMYGHDHSQGFDNYMGGAAVYLPVGDYLNVAKLGSKTEYTSEKLAFTYMNAGFVGYYADWEPETDANNVDSGVDKSITMTVFTIKDNTVTVERYDKNGHHNLKSEGKNNVRHAAKEEALGYSLMTQVYESPQTIVLSHIIADKVTLDSVAEKNAEIKVKYDGADDITSVRMYLNSALPIKEIVSKNDFEYNPADGRIVVYSGDGTAIDKELFTVKYELDGLVADGTYPVDLTLIEATGGDTSFISTIAIDGAIVIDNNYPVGDVSQDGEVTNADLIMIARYLVGLVEFSDKQFAAADYIKDDNVNNVDLIMLARSLVAASAPAAA